MFFPRSLLFISLLLASAAPAAAGTVRIPLPELLGNYPVDGNTLPRDFGRGRQISIPTGISHFGAETATIELKGTIAHGRVRGDGVLRANVETILDGGFGASFFAAGHHFGFLDVNNDLLPPGDFERAWSFQIPFRPGIDDFPCLNCGPRTFTPAVSISFNPSWGRLFDEIPFLAPPGQNEFRRAGDGLITVAPAVGTVTEAYLVIEHRFIPEPATLPSALAALCVCSVILLKRRAPTMAIVRQLSRAHQTQRSATR